MPMTAELRRLAEPPELKMPPPKAAPRIVELALLFDTVELTSKSVPFLLWIPPP